jgi:hypothetical protein
MIADGTLRIPNASHRCNSTAADTQRAVDGPIFAVPSRIPLIEYESMRCALGERCDRSEARFRTGFELNAGITNSPWPNRGSCAQRPWVDTADECFLLWKGTHAFWQPGLVMVFLLNRLVTIVVSKTEGELA